MKFKISVSINKVFSEHRCTCLLIGRFQAEVEQLRQNCLNPTELKILAIWPLEMMFAYSCSKQ